MTCASDCFEGPEGRCRFCEGLHRPLVGCFAALQRIWRADEGSRKLLSGVEDGGIAPPLCKADNLRPHHHFTVDDIVWLGRGANYWAPLTRKRHTLPHPAQPRYTDDWAPRTRK